MMDVQVEKDLVFAAHDGSDLTLDIYRPAHDDAPVTLYVHGGGWRSGDKADDRARRLAPLSACGVTVVSVSYCLVPRARFPGQLHDLKAAVRGSAGTGRAWACPPSGSASGVLRRSLPGLAARPDRRNRQVRGNRRRAFRPVQRRPGGGPLVRPVQPGRIRVTRRGAAR